ncbi:MAG: hypothetical protein N2235_23320 [Fischerella sp.]|nr:hypothetical protein [Fischerella sp.]
MNQISRLLALLLIVVVAVNIVAQTVRYIDRIGEGRPGLYQPW